MAAVTALSPLRRDPGLLSVQVEGRTVATITSRQAAELGVAVGRPWTDALAAAVARAAATAQAERDGLTRLNRRALSRRQLQAKLRERGHDGPAIASALDRLEHLGALDDAALGRNLIDLLTRDRPAGPALIRQRLGRRGLDADLIERLVREHAESAAGSLEQARALVEAQRPALSPLDPPRRLRRLAGLLARRGFEPETIEQVLGELGDEG